MFDALLFDFFGTLVDYRAARVGHRYPETLARSMELGFRGEHDDFAASWDGAMGALEAEAKRTLHEFSMLDVATAFAATVGIRASDRELGDLAASFVAEWSAHVVPVPGVAEMLDRLAPTHQIAIVSNTHDHTMVPDMVERMGVADLIAVTVLSVDHGRQKPHPSIYAAALTELGCPAERAAFIGDNPQADHAGPVAADMRAFLIASEPVTDVPEADRLSSVLDLERILDPSAD